MATPQLSPGLIVREIDLTVGRVQNVVDTVGAIAGPFSIGPVEGIESLLEFKHVKAFHDQDVVGETWTWGEELSNTYN